MAVGRTKKSTKKFERNHLKDTIEKRKEGAKIKQRQQIKAKKQARNASDKARVSDGDDEPSEPAARNKQAADLSKMSVDEFFQGGFDLPEQKTKKNKPTKRKEAPQKTGKRKRSPANDNSDTDEAFDSSFDQEEQLDSEQEDGIEGHKGDLDALAEKDPEFYKYLKENDAELLDFDEEADLAEVDQLSDEETPKKKRKKSKSKEVEDPEDDEEDGSDVTMAMVEKWKAAMSTQHSLRAMRQVVLAFRAAAHVNSDDGKEHKYSLSSPEVYHEVLVSALEQVPVVLSHHLPVKESTTGKVRIATDSKKYRTLIPLLKSHSASILHLLENLTDASTIKLTLSSLLPLLPYILSFKKLLKVLTKTTVNIWSDTSTTETTRITAFLLIRRLALISDASLREAVLKTTYQGLVKGSRITNMHTLSAINLMKNSAAELWGLDANIGYTTGFTYIRQLAVHLRTSITHPTKDSYKTIYNWQYVHSLDFWSRVLSAHCSPASNPQLKTPYASPLHPLIYPLVQITLGALRLIPTPTYFPLRFHLLRSLLRLSRTTNTYIPLAPLLLEVLLSPSLSKPPKPSTLPPLDFATALKAPIAYLRTRTYQSGTGAQVHDLLADFFACWATSIAFPELILPPTVTLKRWLKSNNKNAPLTRPFALLSHKLAAHAAFVDRARASVTFGPAERDGVDRFLADVRLEDTPLGAYVEGARAVAREREEMLERARVGEGRSERERESQGSVDGDDDV